MSVARGADEPGPSDTLYAAAYSRFSSDSCTSCLLHYLLSCRNDDDGEFLVTSRRQVHHVRVGVCLEGGQPAAWHLAATGDAMHEVNDTVLRHSSCCQTLDDCVALSPVFF